VDKANQIHSSINFLLAYQTSETGTDSITIPKTFANQLITLMLVVLSTLIAFKFIALEKKVHLKHN